MAQGLHLKNQCYRRTKSPVQIGRQDIDICEVKGFSTAALRSGTNSERQGERVMQEL